MDTKKIFKISFDNEIYDHLLVFNMLWQAQTEKGEMCTPFLFKLCSEKYYDAGKKDQKKTIYLIISIPKFADGIYENDSIDSISNDPKILSSISGFGLSVTDGKKTFETVRSTIKLEITNQKEEKELRPGSDRGPTVLTANVKFNLNADIKVGKNIQKLDGLIEYDLRIITKMS